MRGITKWLEGGAYFSLGSLVIFLLYYIAQVADGRFPEEGVSIEILTLLIFSVTYYGAFVLVQGGLSRLCKQILEPHYLLPAALAAGMGVGFVFISGLDFLFWLLYQKDMGTIFISALVLEIIFLMMNLGIVWRTANTDKLSFQRVRMTILLLVTAVALVVLAIPLLFE